MDSWKDDNNTDIELEKGCNDDNTIDIELEKGCDDDKHHNKQKQFNKQINNNSIRQTVIIKQYGDEKSKTVVDTDTETDCEDNRHNRNHNYRGRC